MIQKQIIAVAFAIGLTASMVHAKPNVTGSTMKVTDQVRRQVATVPYANVWDWIEAEVRPDGSVILQGAVTQPSVKADAESRVRSIEAVSQVINDIHVLPLSYSDNAIRLGVYRALFNANSPLMPYALGGNPSIHIIVENGKVTLKGVVSSAMDKQLATFAANGVFGVHVVDNELRLESEL